MAGRYRAEPIGQFVFDKVYEAFQDTAKEKTEFIQEDLDEIFKDFFTDIAGFLDKDTTPDKVALMGYDWEDNSASWIKRKHQESNRFGVGLKGLLLANVKRLDPVRAYGRPEIVFRAKDGRLRWGSLPKTVSARIGFTAFPKVGAAPSRLISVFAPRQRKILRFNEPIARRGSVHDRPFLYPMFRYYTEIALPEAFKDA